MKEQEKAGIKRLSDRLDALNHKEPNVIQQGDPKQLKTLETEIYRLKNLRVGS